MQSNTPWRSRYTKWRVLLGVLTALLLAAILYAAKSDKPFFWKNAPPVISLSVMCLSYLFICWWARAQALKEEKALPATVEGGGPRKQSFLWQAILILLPVMLMAGFGFWAIWRARNEVEQEARQRAREILRALPAEFGRIAASRLSEFEGAKNGWYGYLRWAVAAWPENKNRKQWLADTNEPQILTNQLATLHSVFPEWPAGPVPQENLLLDTNGNILDREPRPPRPPSWLAAMSTEQQQAWAALQQAAYAGQSLSNLAGLSTAFRQTQPPPAALACAEFIQLRAGLPSVSASNAVDQLLRFGGYHYDIISDSGLPLTSLALAEALKYAREGGPTERLWESLQAEITPSSAFAPLLLDKAGRLVAKDAQLSEAIKAMRVLLADEQAQSELAEAVQQSGKVLGITTTNLWVDALNQRWFCILSPSETHNGTSISNRAVWTTNAVTEVRCYPQPLVARAFADALKEVEISLPDYFGVSLELEGAAVLLPSPWSKAGAGKPAGDILAEAPFHMSERAVMRERDSDTGLEKDVPFEDMPSHPRFTLQIRLADRTRLYAKQRQLQFVFEALIASSTLAALIGFFAAYRAFRRQLQLNAMKSNFVSSVSHELRAPIASVRLLAENLEGGKILEPAKQKEYFAFIVQECRRLSSLVENVLDFSRIEQGRKQYEFEATDLGALTRTTVKLMEPYAAEKGVKLETAGPPEPTPHLEASVDSRAIQQALVNLIDNAIKHSARGETVGVGIEAKNGPATPVICLWVADHGPGIPAAEQEKIFERFYRRGSELRRETQGVGIGLSIVKHIVEAHGGRVTVRSAVGKGSRFTIELPLKNHKAG